MYQFHPTDSVTFLPHKLRIPYNPTQKILSATSRDASTHNSTLATTAYRNRRIDARPRMTWRVPFSFAGSFQMKTLNSIAATSLTSGSGCSGFGVGQPRYVRRVRAHVGD